MRMSRRILGAITCLGSILVAAAARADDESSPGAESSDAQAVRKVAEEIGEAWARQDAKGVGCHYTEDADYVNIMGLVLEGRKAIEVRHAEIFTTVLKGSQANFEVRSVRLLAPGVAVADVNGAVMDIKPASTSLRLDADGSIRSRIKHVLVKRDGNWVVVSTQSTQVVTQERR